MVLLRINQVGVVVCNGYLNFIGYLAFRLFLLAINIPLYIRQAKIDETEMEYQTKNIKLLSKNVVSYDMDRCKYIFFYIYNINFIVPLLIQYY